MSKDQLETLKERATQMGISFSPNIGIEKLREKINSKLGTEESTEKVDKQSKAYKIKEATKLIRCKITNRNPNKKSWRGEIISTGNALIPEMKKFIAFNTPYHVPQMLLNVMKERKYQVFYKVTNSKGDEETRTKLENEFLIEILPPLTKEEYMAIRQQQLARQGIE